MWIVDELPEGGIRMLLFKAGILRPRRQTEEYPKMVSNDDMVTGVYSHTRARSLSFSLSLIHATPKNVSDDDTVMGVYSRVYQVPDTVQSWGHS